MKQLIVLSAALCVGAALPAGFLGAEPGAIYGRLQRDSYVPYPKPDYTKLYLALKNARIADQTAQVEPAYDYAEMSRPIGSIYEPRNDMFEYDAEAEPQSLEDIIPNQQWMDIGTLYDAPIDEEGLEQQKEMMRQMMANYIEKKSSKKTLQDYTDDVKGSTKGSSGKKMKTTQSSSSTTTTTTKAPATSSKAPQQQQHKEDKVPNVSKLFGQKEYAMLRPAGTADSRRPLPELWPEEGSEVAQLKRASRRIYRKPSSVSGASEDVLTKELDTLRH